MDSWASEALARRLLEERRRSSEMALADHLSTKPSIKFGYTTHPATLAHIPLREAPPASPFRAIRVGLQSGASSSSARSRLPSPLASGWQSSSPFARRSTEWSLGQVAKTAHFKRRSNSSLANELIGRRRPSECGFAELEPGDRVTTSGANQEQIYNDDDETTVCRLGPSNYYGCDNEEKYEPRYHFSPAPNQPPSIHSVPEHWSSPLSLLDKERRRQFLLGLSNSAARRSNDVIGAHWHEEHEVCPPQTCRPLSSLSNKLRNLSSASSVQLRQKQIHPMRIFGDYEAASKCGSSNCDGTGAGSLTSCDGSSVGAGQQGRQSRSSLSATSPTTSGKSNFHPLDDNNILTAIKDRHRSTASGQQIIQKREVMSLGSLSPYQRPLIQQQQQQQQQQQLPLLQLHHHHHQQLQQPTRRINDEAILRSLRPTFEEVNDNDYKPQQQQQFHECTAEQTSLTFHRDSSNLAALSNDETLLYLDDEDAHDNSSRDNNNNKISSYINGGCSRFPSSSAAQTIGSQIHLEPFHGGTQDNLAGYLRQDEHLERPATSYQFDSMLNQKSSPVCHDLNHDQQLRFQQSRRFYSVGTRPQDQVGPYFRLQAADSQLSQLGGPLTSRCFELRQDDEVGGGHLAASANRSSCSLACGYDNESMASYPERATYDVFRSRQSSVRQRVQSNSLGCLPDAVTCEQKLVGNYYYNCGSPNYFAADPACRGLLETSTPGSSPVSSCSSFSLRTQMQLEAIAAESPPLPRPLLMLNDYKSDDQSKLDNEVERLGLAPPAATAFDYCQPLYNTLKNQLTLREQHELKPPIEPSAQPGFFVSRDNTSNQWIAPYPELMRTACNADNPSIEAFNQCSKRPAVPPQPQLFQNHQPSLMTQTNSIVIQAQPGVHHYHQDTIQTTLHTEATPAKAPPTMRQRQPSSSAQSQQAQRHSTPVLNSSQKNQRCHRRRHHQKSDAHFQSESNLYHMTRHDEEDEDQGNESDSGLSLVASRRMPMSIVEQMKEQASNFVNHYGTANKRGRRTLRRKANLQVRRTLRVKIKKSKPILGIAIEGGFNVSGQLLPRIVCVHEDGSAYQCGKLRASDLILEVNGKSTVNMTHDEIAKTIANAYYQDTRSHIEFLIGESVHV